MVVSLQLDFPLSCCLISRRFELVCAIGAPEGSLAYEFSSDLLGSWEGGGEDTARQQRETNEEVCES